MKRLLLVIKVASGSEFVGPAYLPSVACGAGFNFEANQFHFRTRRGLYH
ncbi:MAG TPA: hypothetical protein VM911_08100 [Pyrinomonadaceae bacterium]|nr:hypothetical protein [Pyrinomonadaceae bacterium]